MNKGNKMKFLNTHKKPGKPFWASPAPAAAGLLFVFFISSAFITPPSFQSSSEPGSIEKGASPVHTSDIPGKGGDYIIKEPGENRESISSAPEDEKNPSFIRKIIQKVTSAVQGVISKVTSTVKSVLQKIPIIGKKFQEQPSEITKEGKGISPTSPTPSEGQKTPGAGKEEGKAPGGILSFLKNIVTGARETAQKIVGGAREKSQELPSAARRLPGVAQIVTTTAVPPRYMSTIMGVDTPLAVAVSPRGDRIYIAEGSGERRILVLTEDGTLIGYLMPPSSRPGLRMPASLAVDSRGVIYAVDRLRLAVDMYNSRGQWLGLLDPESRSLRWEPAGISLDSKGNVYITNSADGAPRVVVFSKEGKQIARFGTDLELNFPTSVAVADNGFMYVSDSNRGKVAVFGPEGKLMGSVGKAVGDELLSIPRGVALDNRGRLYVIDAIDHAIKVWDITASPERFLFRVGDLGFSDAQFRYPNSIWEDGKGHLFIADRDNGRVQVWANDGASPMVFPTRPVAPASIKTSPDGS